MSEEQTFAALTLAENALTNFLENPIFVVSVGGNPLVVDGMLAQARMALARTRSVLAATPQGTEP